MLALRDNWQIATKNHALCSGPRDLELDEDYDYSIPTCPSEIHIRADAMPAFPVLVATDAGGGYMDHGPPSRIPSPDKATHISNRVHRFLETCSMEEVPSYPSALEGRQVTKCAIAPFPKMHSIDTTGYNVNGNPNTQPRQVDTQRSHQDPPQRRNGTWRKASQCGLKAQYRKNYNMSAQFVNETTCKNENQ